MQHKKSKELLNEVKTIYETNQFGVTNVRNCINILGFGDCGITNDHIKGIIRFVMLLNKWQLKARQRKRNKLRRRRRTASRKLREPRYTFAAGIYRQTACQKAGYSRLLGACGVDSPAWLQRPSNIPSAEV